MALLEKHIKTMMLHWLKMHRHCIAFNHDSVGIYDQKIGRYRKRTGVCHRNGVSDILGIWRGKPLAIEVKTPKGVMTEEQEKFLTEWRLKGGIAILARSLDDLIHQLTEYDRQNAKN